MATYSLTWDAANQLTQEVSNDGTAISPTIGRPVDRRYRLAERDVYSYDATGNRTMTGYSTGTGNRLASDGTFNYTYDDEGNLATKTEIATSKVTDTPGTTATA